MNIHSKLSNAIRFLSIDAVQKANSGHPGMPMGMADIATVLWRKHLNHNPKNPKWINRDRFVLSNGHGSMLLYSLLHLSGYDVSIKDLKDFRQLHSCTPGHPEYSYTPGVETTTGPLGQGLANAVGMALAEKILSDTYNKSDCSLIDHYTYVFIGDGCLMEGISHEVSSLAGTLKLGKLITFWDNNKISIDGNVNGWFTENVAMRYRSYGWQVIEDINGHNFEDIDHAINLAKKENNKPTLICCNTTIGYGSPNKEGSEKIHGAPLGLEEIINTRKNLNWPHEPFFIPEDIYSEWDMSKEGEAKEEIWKIKSHYYETNYSKDFLELHSRLNGISKNFLSDKMDKYIDKNLKNKTNNIATRKASQMVIEELKSFLPAMFGGSADLTGSNLTHSPNKSIWVNKCKDNLSYANYLSYGVREFGMSAMMNGISLYGGFIPYGGTFLVFTDYARNAIRMSAIMKQPVIYVMTHDSIGLGEDGPTHQPVEHIPSLRLIPNLNVWRPADIFETIIAWKSAIEELDTPSILSLSRQNLPTIIDNKNKINLISKGGYLVNYDKKSVLTLLATGSEVEIALKTQKILYNENNIITNVVSVPCVEKFLSQTKLYIDSVIAPNIPLVVIEATIGDLWYRLLPSSGGRIISMNTFGESAPANLLYKKFNLTPEYVQEQVITLLNK